MKKIFDLSAKEAQQHFMNAKSYFTNALPTHFNFLPVLKAAKKAIGNKTLKECLAEGLDCAPENVNLHISLKKDAQYGYRPIQLTHPALYWMLVRDITAVWDKLNERFEAYSCPGFSAYGLPVVKEASDDEAFEKATTILNWWENFEQQSIDLSLDYDCMFSTDLTNCYGNISHAVIKKAFTGVGTQRADKELEGVAGALCQYLALMQDGNTVGIPQGAEVYDVLAELVLAYADRLLFGRLEEKGIHGYRVLRYRDDYRIFANDESLLTLIADELQQVLIGLGLFMNPKKTSTAENIVSESVKGDKLFYILNTPIKNKKGVDFDGLQKHLMFLHEFTRRFPGSGHLLRLMSEFDERLISWIEGPKKKAKPAKVLASTAKDWETVVLEEIAKTADGTSIMAEQEKDPEVLPAIKENVAVMSAIVADIAMINPRAIPMAMTIISRMTETIHDAELRDKLKLRVARKMMRQTNSGYCQVWLQQLTFDCADKGAVPAYNSPLCSVVGREPIELWNHSWLKEKLQLAIKKPAIFTGKVESIIAPQISGGYNAVEAQPVSTY